MVALIVIANLRSWTMPLTKLFIILLVHRYVLYKMKYWREYYLTKHKIKHFGRIIIGDVDKIILYVLICSLELL